jgi:hypothetical protein
MEMEKKKLLERERGGDGSSGERGKVRISGIYGKEKDGRMHAQTKTGEAGFGSSTDVVVDVQVLFPPTSYLFVSLAQPHPSFQKQLVCTQYTYNTQL